MFHHSTPLWVIYKARQMQASMYYAGIKIDGAKEVSSMDITYLAIYKLNRHAIYIVHQFSWFFIWNTFDRFVTCYLCIYIRIFLYIHPCKAVIKFNAWVLTHTWSCGYARQGMNLTTQCFYCKMQLKRTCSPPAITLPLRFASICPCWQILWWPSLITTLTVVQFVT